MYFDPSSSKWKEGPEPPAPKVETRPVYGPEGLKGSQTITEYPSGKREVTTYPKEVVTPQGSSYYPNNVVTTTTFTPVSQPVQTTSQVQPFQQMVDTPFASQFAKVTTFTPITSTMSPQLQQQVQSQQMSMASLLPTSGTTMQSANLRNEYIMTAGGPLLTSITQQRIKEQNIEAASQIYGRQSLMGKVELGIGSAILKPFETGAALLGLSGKNVSDVSKSLIQEQIEVPKTSLGRFEQAGGYWFSGIGSIAIAYASGPAFGELSLAAKTNPLWSPVIKTGLTGYQFYMMGATASEAYTLFKNPTREQGAVSLLRLGTSFAVAKMGYESWLGEQNVKAMQNIKEISVPISDEMRLSQLQVDKISGMAITTTFKEGEATYGLSDVFMGEGDLAKESVILSKGFQNKEFPEQSIQFGNVITQQGGVKGIVGSVATDFLKTNEPSYDWFTEKINVIQFGREQIPGLHSGNPEDLPSNWLGSFNPMTKEVTVSDYLGTKFEPFFDTFKEAFGPPYEFGDRESTPQFIKDWAINVKETGLSLDWWHQNRIWQGSFINPSLEDVYVHEIGGHAFNFENQVSERSKMMFMIDKLSTTTEGMELYDMLLKSDYSKRGQIPEEFMAKWRERNTPFNFDITRVGARTTEGSTLESLAQMKWNTEKVTGLFKQEIIEPTSTLKEITRIGDKSDLFGNLHIKLPATFVTGDVISETGMRGRYGGIFLGGIGTEGGGGNVEGGNELLLQTRTTMQPSISASMALKSSTFSEISSSFKPLIISPTIKQTKTFTPVYSQVQTKQEMLLPKSTMFQKSETSLSSQMQVQKSYQTITSQSSILKTYQTPSTLIKQTQGFLQGSSQLQSQSSLQGQMQKTVSSSLIGTPSMTIPKLTGGFAMPQIKFPSGGFSISSGLKMPRGKQKKKYRPSLYGIMSGIRIHRQPKMSIGIEPRYPISYSLGKKRHRKKRR